MRLKNLTGTDFQLGQILWDLLSHSVRYGMYVYEPRIGVVMGLQMWRGSEIYAFRVRSKKSFCITRPRFRKMLRHARIFCAVSSEGNYVISVFIQIFTLMTKILWFYTSLFPYIIRDCDKIFILTLSTLGKIFSRWHIEIFFLFFLRNRDLTFLAKCLETICMKCQSLFYGTK